MQFFNSLHQIMQSKGVNPAMAICRHLSWQARRAMGKFPCELRLSQSILLAEEPTGVAALVNAMGMYDFNNMSLLRAALERDVATFVDVGANIGPYTLIASEHKETFVVSLEPHPETFIKLARNVERNGRKNVACLNLAISDHDGRALLSDGRYSSLNRLIDPARAGQKCLSVPCRTLDSLCAELNIRPDVIKIDVEGHEAQVIQGFRENLGSASLVMIEGGEKVEIRSAMRKEGLLGPFYFHQSENAFLPTPQARAEDPVYLSAAWLKERGAFGAVLANEKQV